MTVLGLTGIHVPNGWDVVPAGYLFRRQKRTGCDQEQLLSVYRDYGVVPKDSRDDNFNKASEDLSSYQLVEPNDLVINKMKAWQGSVGVSAHRGIVSPAYFVATPAREFNRRYVHYLLRCSDYLLEYQTRSAGIRVNQWDLDWDDFRGVPVALPPRAEQESIANFLDEQTARIDALIAEKEQLLKLLADYRSLSIAECVLGKDILKTGFRSGPAAEPWIDEVPSHWGLPKVKHLFRTTSGSTPSTDKRELYYDGELPWIRSLDLQNGPVTSAEVFITEAALKDTACKMLPRGTVLLAMYGGDGTIGKSGLLEIEASCNQALCAVLPSAEVEPRYLHWYMVFRRPYWMVNADGTRKDPNISQEVVREARFPLPPIEEQMDIAARLDVLTGQVDELCTHCSEHIERLREYRSSLISAAVTGQVDLRSFKSTAPIKELEGAVA